MINLIFKERDGALRSIGYSTVNYSSNDNEEVVVETTEDELSRIFNEADSDKLAETGNSIEEAVDDPLRFRDYLILLDGVIEFDEDYFREEED